MANDSQTKEPRFWERWRASGAVGDKYETETRSYIRERRGRQKYLKNLTLNLKNPAKPEVEELEQMVKQVLQVLADGGSCDYGPVQSGDVILFDEKGRRVGKEVDISIFLQLKSEGIIAKVSSMEQGHLFLHGQVDSYGITIKGRECL